jgi:uncharacterized hydrophobic protein (TIGR00271 family)
MTLVEVLRMSAAPNEDAGTSAARLEASEQERPEPAAESGVPRRAVRDAIRDGALLDGPFVLSNLAATVIATAGLLGDSAATVIGAMLIATLMGPIMGVGLALVEYDNRLLWRALRTLAAGTVMVFAVAFVLGHLAVQSPATSEMLSRTSPRPADLVVALASGAVCAYALTTSRLNAAVFGVAIAVALVPPLATSGLFIARAEWDRAGGAFLLAFVNMVAIQVGTSAALWLRGFRGRTALESRGVGADLRRQTVSFALMAALIAALAYHGMKLARQQSFQAEVRAALGAALASRPEAALVDLTFVTRDGRTTATAVVRSPERFTGADLAEMEKRLPRSPGGAPVKLTMRHVELDVVSDQR